MEENAAEFPVASIDGPKYTIRFVDESLKTTLNAIAKANGRSLNTEINARLAASLDMVAADTTRAYLEKEFAEIKRELLKTQKLIRGAR